MSKKQAGVFDYMLVVITAIIGVTLGITTIWWIYESWSTELYLSSMWSFFHLITRCASVVALIPLGMWTLPALFDRIADAIERVLNSLEARNNARNNFKQEQATSKPTTF